MRIDSLASCVRGPPLPESKRPRGSEDGIALLNRKTSEEKAAEEQARAEANAAEEAVRAAAAEQLAAHVATLQKWEYHVETIDLTSHWTKAMQAAAIQTMRDKINALGAEGWEMISYESIPMYGSFSNNLKGYAYVTFFKRPKMP
jgi:hypothetical protein